MPVSTVETAAYDRVTSIQEWVRTYWVNGATPRTPIVYGNNLDVVDTDGTFDESPPDNAPWIRVSIIPAVTRVATHGSEGLNETRGAVVINVFGPKEAGEGAILLVAGKVAAMMDRKDINNVVMLAANVGPVIDDIRDGWSFCTVTIPFYDNARTV